MNNIKIFPIQTNFINETADFIVTNYPSETSDFSRLAFVFEGKRPSLFLKKAIAKRIGGSFFPPVFFSIDEFISYLLSKNMSFENMPNMERWHIIYSLAKKIAPALIKGRTDFSNFLPWAMEIEHVIDLMDLENISDQEIENIEASACIGYEVPDTINILLKNIKDLRDLYHGQMNETKSFSKGFIYKKAMECSENIDFHEFDNIFFAGIFYAHKTVKIIIKNLLEQNKTQLIIHGNPSEWKSLGSLYSSFNITPLPIEDTRTEKKLPLIKLYTAFDTHSSIAIARDLAKKTVNPETTLILLPKPENMVPFVTELASIFESFNVSLGYPLNRSSFYSLIELIMKAQLTKKNKAYYVKDYLGVLRHALVKSLSIKKDYAITRIIVHKIEEASNGIFNSSFSGQIFINTESIENDDKLMTTILETLEHMGLTTSREDLTEVMRELHNLLFNLWENINSFYKFAGVIGIFVETFIQKGQLAWYPLNVKTAERLCEFKDEIENSSFSGEEFTKEDIFKIFINMFEHEISPFTGSPLKGVQVLGPLETRSLNFEHVIIMDANEGVFPRIRASSPLIPYEILKILGIDPRSRENEIQKYLFTRIVQSAKNIDIIYQKGADKERSRFLEELIWRAEQEKNALNVIPLQNVSFPARYSIKQNIVKKTRDITDFLKEFCYSVSSVNTYLKCPLMFYYKYVLGLKEKEELEDEPGGKEIGTFIHELLEYTFGMFKNKKPVLNDEFKLFFFRAFDTMFHKVFESRMASSAFLLKKIIQYRLQEFLKYESVRIVREILYLEKKFKEELFFNGVKFNFKYIVDRVDALEDGSILILDYKTGLDAVKPKENASLETMPMDRLSIKKNIRSFQLPVYYYFEKKKYPSTQVNAAFYSLRRPKLTYLIEKNTDIDFTIKQSMNALEFILNEITSHETDFCNISKDEEECSYCPFNSFCG
ncbi:hypothetical protein OMAG_000838 [Candidatus Omnitrophus magneticus]|uniref:PD-(D/E)XK endonuclease-like domain-containing protein n=1 Tax=Candidatus Omnitrophus magneticus TaxID=1609969 RepID=A0A0F0CTE6_9BACT|nr:hypothetical protein OMAG_000838 [Candidatus Omnitrophus magneticus]